ncbi:MAG: hypothetical protein KDD40_12615 [Bdellovibrionales bacterium]|nr:hypothetical protein [Bdellovibrionales bacterium]
MKVLIALLMLVPVIAFAELPFNMNNSIKITITGYSSGNLRGGYLREQNDFYLKAVLNPDRARYTDDATIASSGSTKVPYFQSTEVSEELLLTGRQILDAAAEVEWLGEYNLRIQLYENNLLVDKFVRSEFIPMEEIDETPKTYQINDRATGASATFTVQKVRQN